MGNQQSKGTNSSGIQILKKYEQVRQSQDGIIYRQKKINSQTNQQYLEHYILKEHLYPNESLYNQAFNVYKSQLQRNKIPQNDENQRNTLSLNQVVKEQIEHFCSNTYKIYTLFEYPQLNLKNQIQVRATMSKYFQECQLIAILQTCVMALHQIKSIICFSTNCIFISPQGVIKVLHGDLVDESYRHLMTANIYYAPEKFTNFNVQSSSQHSLKKQIIFSMGMTIIQACLLQDLHSLYDYDTKTFDQSGLQNKMSKLTQSYSADFVELLTNMLEQNPNRRISLLQIQRNLNRYDQVNDQVVYNQEEKHQMQKTCEKYFQKSNGKATNMQSSVESKDQPNIPNLLSNHNTSRISINQTNNYHINKTNNCHLDQTNNYHCNQIINDQFTYKVITPNQNISSSLNRGTANFSMPSSGSIQGSSRNDNLFTDPKLLQMIRQDLQQISKSRTSRINYQQNTIYETSNQLNFMSNTNNVHNSIYDSRSDYNNYPYRQDPHSNNSYRQDHYSNYPYGQDPYKRLSNCPQVESLAASIAMQNNTNKKYVYEESEVKRRPDENLQNSIALSMHNFAERLNQSGEENAQRGQYYAQRGQDNAQREPLRQVFRNQVPRNSFPQIQQEIKKDMMKKKQSEVVYLEELYEDGVKYEGMSKNGVKQGYGKLIYNDGAYYEGYFHEDKISGKGILYYRKNQPAYNGQWLDEQFNGYGELYNQDPQPLTSQFPYHNFNLLQNYWIKYEGQFIQDYKHGKGKIYLTTNQWIEAEFRDDMVNGWGKFFLSSNRIIQGRWENNVLVELHDQ